MTAASALAAGVALGLAYFGTLWLVVRRIAPGRGWTTLALSTGIARYTLLAAGLFIFARQGAVWPLLLMVCGLWLGRQGLMRLVGEGRHVG